MEQAGARASYRVFQITLRGAPDKILLRPPVGDTSTKNAWLRVRGKRAGIIRLPARQVQSELNQSYFLHLSSLKDLSDEIQPSAA